MARKKNNIWHIVGINAENVAKTITIDLSFVTQTNGFLITDGVNGFEKLPVAKAKPLSVTIQPNGGFVVKI
jgi:hypothetical protein